MQQIKAGAHNEIAADEFMMTHLKSKRTVADAE